MLRLSLSVLLAIQSVAAFGWVAGLDTPTLRRSLSKRASCPYNSNHTGAAPYNSNYPYNGAQGGLPGLGQGGYQVPAPGDTAHYFTPPGPNDIRGPCPGLNAAANHNFLSHDGITTFEELVDAQQNVYNVAYDLAVFLATLGTAEDGDILTGRVSIGCDATSRTSATGGLLGDEYGLNGHNKFEGDTSLTRNDYYLSPTNDDFSFNGTLFGNMQSTCNGDFNQQNLALYRYQRYGQSLTTNGNFYFGPKSLLLYGAASFLYELFPTANGPPDLPTISSFFGASTSTSGGWTFTNTEQIPPNWFARTTPYTLVEIALEIVSQYLLHLVLFGGNTGSPNSFDVIDFGEGIQGGKLLNGEPTAEGVMCLLYQLGTENVPSSLLGGVTLAAEVITWSIGKLNPVFQNTGCTLL